MKVKEIIAYACEFIGEKELAEKLNSQETVTYSAKNRKKWIVYLGVLIL